MTRRFKVLRLKKRGGLVIHDSEHDERMSAVEYDILNESDLPWTWSEADGLPFDRCTWCNEGMGNVTDRTNEHRTSKTRFALVRDHMVEKHEQLWLERVFDWITTEPDERR